MNHFITLTNVKKTKSVFYTDIDPLQIEKKQFDKLSKAGFAGKESGQRKNDYGSCGELKF